MGDLRLTGRVLKVLPLETGTSAKGEWKKQVFVIETNDQYPKTIAFTLFGDRSDLIKNITVGQTVEVGFNLESREYNEKYFHNINAWFVNAVQSESVAPQPIPGTPYQPTTPPPAAPQQQGVGGNNPGTEDLPF